MIQEFPSQFLSIFEENLKLYKDDKSIMLDFVIFNLFGELNHQLNQTQLNSLLKLVKSTFLDTKKIAKFSIAGFARFFEIFA